MKTSLPSQALKYPFSVSAYVCIGLSSNCAYFPYANSFSVCPQFSLKKLAHSMTVFKWGGGGGGG